MTVTTRSFILVKTVSVAHRNFPMTFLSFYIKFITYSTALTILTEPDSLNPFDDLPWQSSPYLVFPRRLSWLFTLVPFYFHTVQLIPTSREHPFCPVLRNGYFCRQCLILISLASSSAHHLNNINTKCQIASSSTSTK